MPGVDPKAAFRTGPKGGAPGGLSAEPLPGQGSFASMAEIVAIVNNVFSCQWHDGAGALTGDPFIVFVASYPASGGMIGQQSLENENCDPQRVPGDLIAIEQRNQYVGNGQYISGWWAIQEFTIFGSECACEEP
jgi:hypothetical protein